MNNTQHSPDTPKPPLVNESVLSELATTAVPIDRSHLAEGLAPPTNKWYSGFALQADPKPGYTYPNSFMPLPSGFEFSLPRVRVEEKVIAGTHVPDIVATIEGARSYTITDYDELTVELTYYDGKNKALASVHIASGLPYVYVTAKQDIAVHTNGKIENQGSWAQIENSGMYYGINVAVNDNSFRLSGGEYASFFSAPSKDDLETVRKYADTVVDSAQVSYERQAGTFATTFHYDTTGGKPTLFAYLPHQQAGEESEVTYQSILGDLTTSTGTTFSFETPLIQVESQLDLSEISADQRQLLSEQLRSDIGQFKEKSDTYFGGKQLYRMAQLLVLAKQLDDDELASTAQTIIKRELESWLTPGRTELKSFKYEPLMQSIIGNEASFGSDKELNDHHFHYGYFIYAAAILAEYDTRFLSTYSDMINLLAADIANYNKGEKLPLRRTFDPYAGHSWASGTSPFKDGNNQESTSEAINAWVGVALWAEQTDNHALRLQADWMLSQEYTTAQHYWLLRQGKTPAYLQAYDKPIVSIVWGGKREYATFFSDEPNAKLAIQLLPLNPTMRRIGTNYPKNIFRGTSWNETYGDYILMASPNATLEDAFDLPDAAIDDGNSRSYLYAYILSR